MSGDDGFGSVDVEVRPDDGVRPDVVLLANITAALPELEQLLETVSSEWVYDDLVYRFWHQSFKCYALQDYTVRMVEALTSVAPPGCSLDRWFVAIVEEGTGRPFEMSHNADWLRFARPVVDAFFHARFMLEMVVKSGRSLAAAPRWLPSGWAAVLELYGIR